MTLIKCVCFTEGFEITPDDECDVAYVQYWRLGDHHLSWLTRLRWAWRILQGRDEWPQELAFERGELLKLRRELDEILKSMEGSK